MTASVGNIVLYILFLWIVPVFVGNAVCNKLSMRGTIPRSFVMGYLSMWAVFQIITVPLILLKVSFLVDVVVYSIFLVGIIAYGIVKKTYRSMTIPKVEPSAWGGIIVMLAVGIYMIVQSYRLQLTNADDTRFVVNAVDTVRTNRMLITDIILDRRFVQGCDISVGGICGISVKDNRHFGGKHDAYIFTTGIAGGDDVHLLVDCRRVI